MFWIVLITAAGAGLTDAGRPVAGPPVLIPVTPGVAPEGYGTWVQAIERRGLDAWLFEAEPDWGPDRVRLELAAAAQTLEQRGPLRVAAHGWGGVFALSAGVEAERWALVGVPLAPQAAAGPLGGERWPWPDELLGGLPEAPVDDEVLSAYRRWVSAPPPLEVPEGPVLLLASNLDAVAPPEIVRLPSRGWPQRTWERSGRLALSGADPLHAELLSDARTARRVADFLGGG